MLNKSLLKSVSELKVNVAICAFYIFNIEWVLLTAQVPVESRKLAKTSWSLNPVHLAVTPPTQKCSFRCYSKLLDSTQHSKAAGQNMAMSSVGNSCFHPTMQNRMLPHP